MNNACHSFHGISSDQRAVLARLAVILLLGLLLTFVIDTFGTFGNVITVLRQASLLFLVAFGLTFVVISGGLDLSIGANISLSACLAAAAIKSTGSITLGLLAGLSCGTLIGLINGCLIVLVRVPAFIATYGVAWIIHGVAYWYMNGEAIYGMPQSFRMLGTGFLIWIPVPVYLMLAALIAGGFMAQRTIWGQQIYAIGANPSVAYLSGVPVGRRQLSVYVLSGVIGGLASLVYLARLNSAEAEMGEALTLQAIAAVLIGGTSLFGGKGSLAGTLMGTILLALIVNAMNMAGVNAGWQPLITGVIVIFSVLFDAISMKNK